MSAQIKIRFAFICDDARREDNGKLIYIGVYGQNIVVHELPFSATLTLAVWFETEKAIDIEFQMRVTLDDKQIAGGSGRLKVGEGVGASIIPQIPIAADKEGVLKFELKFGDNDWEIATTIPIISRNVAA